MPLYEFEGKRPTVHPDAFVAPTATLIGDVTVEAGASIWYGAVLRADICTIVVREGTNVQDGSVLHAAPGETLTVGPNASIGHSCVVHCTDVGEQALIGNGSTLLDGARVGARTLVGAGSVVTPGRSSRAASSPPASPPRGQARRRQQLRAVDRVQRALLPGPRPAPRPARPAEPGGRRTRR